MCGGSETRAHLINPELPKGRGLKPYKPYNHFLQSCCAPGWEAFPLGCTPCWQGTAIRCGPDAPSCLLRTIHFFMLV